MFLVCFKTIRPIPLWEMVVSTVSFLKSKSMNSALQVVHHSTIVVMVLLFIWVYSSDHDYSYYQCLEGLIGID